MKVFISWSGELSKLVAECLKTWIEDIMQGVQAWMSNEDIEKGAIWLTDVSDQLAETNVGIICLTQENLDSPWILFEAGALAKGLSKSRVCPLLINLEPSDLRLPLAQLHATRPNETDMWKLIKTINAQNSESTIPEDRLERTFKRWWGDFESNFNSIVSNYSPKKRIHRRSMEDKLRNSFNLQEVLKAVFRAQSPTWRLCSRILFIH